MKNTIISERLTQMVDYLGITANDFAKKLGYNRSQAIYDMLSGKAKPSFDFFEKLLNSEYSATFNIEWVFTGLGNMTKSFNNIAEPSSVYQLRTDKLIEHQAIPLYDLEASAGVVTLFRDSKNAVAMDYIQIPNLPKCDGAIYVTGDSMYPLLKSGDIVMYKQMFNIEEGLIFGEMYIVSIDYDGDEIVSVKWVKKSEKGAGFIKLVSQNQHHEDRDIPLTRVRALALVKASIRINSMS